jgi:hypothetical protein
VLGRDATDPHTKPPIASVRAHAARESGPAARLSTCSPSVVDLSIDGRSPHARLGCDNPLRAGSMPGRWALPQAIEDSGRQLPTVPLNPTACPPVAAGLTTFPSPMARVPSSRREGPHKRAGGLGFHRAP